MYSAWALFGLIDGFALSAIIGIWVDATWMPAVTLAAAMLGYFLGRGLYSLSSYRPLSQTIISSGRNDTTLATLTQAELVDRGLVRFKSGSIVPLEVAKGKPLFIMLSLVGIGFLYLDTCHRLFDNLNPGFFEWVMFWKPMMKISSVIIPAVSVEVEALANLLMESRANYVEHYFGFVFIWSLFVSAVYFYGFREHKVATAMARRVKSSIRRDEMASNNKKNLILLVGIIVPALAVPIFYLFVEPLFVGNYDPFDTDNLINIFASPFHGTKIYAGVVATLILIDGVLMLMRSVLQKE